jgi:dGTPase
MMEWITLFNRYRHGKKQVLDQSGIRSEFEADYDRIIFSHPFRRLQDKTQVFPLPEHDFVHTRLTHSLEVSSVARSLGKRVAVQLCEKYPELTAHHIGIHEIGAVCAAGALAHDIGNPPFGHSGEAAISDFFKTHPLGQQCKVYVNEDEWEDLIRFEGNAQGFRLLNKKQYQGLSLTYATLGAFTKYPRAASGPAPLSGRRSQKKFGFFQSEKKVFLSMAANTGLIRLGNEKHPAYCRHPLAFLVEAADDICYHLIDLEDGCRLGLISLQDTIDLMAELIGSKFQPRKLVEYTDPNEKIALLRAMAIGQLIGSCADLFIQKEPEILSGEFDMSLTELIPEKETLKKISDISIEKLYRHHAVVETEVAGYEVINGLLEAYIGACLHARYDKDRYSNKDKGLVRLLPVGIKEKVQVPEADFYTLLREILDYISGMTDRFAISSYRKIKGIYIPGGAKS